MRNPSQMLVLLLPLEVVVLAAMLATPSLGRVMDDSKCKCLMCVCDVDPHPLPPELPSHHHPAPPEEPEPEPTPVYHYPPPHAEPAPVYYLPPPGQPAYGGQYPYPSQGQSPVLGIVGTPTVMYPQYIRSAAARRRRSHHGLCSRLVASALLVSGVLPLIV
ncbi:extensin-like [Oryza brachyantha]|uniref:extensin-like n=1 Tax=Oryza brachyantha TaxID=4533 RepID=UPI001ADB20B3|nr:extensin-like [Oryza brachyantha]